MLRALYDYTLALAAHRHADKALFGVAFVESSVFPIPPDVMLMPMVLAERHRAWVLAGICTAGSVLGALVGYAIGALLYDTVGQALVALYGGAEAMARFVAFYDSWGAWVVFASAVSFLPFKIATIAAGVATMNPLLFILTSLGGRAIRFFAVAGLLYAFGPTIRKFIDRWFGALSLAFVVLLLAGFALFAIPL